MRKFLFPIQDAAIYAEFANQNAGYDEILEIGSTNDGHFAVRSLIQFDLPGIIVPATASYDLILRIANAEKLKAKQGVEVCQLSQSWDEGSGYYHQTLFPERVGVTWTQRTSGSSWAGGLGGASVTNLPVVSSSFNYNMDDLVIDVTSIVQSWQSGTPNYGFLVRFPVADEADINNKGNVKFFSGQTHTIYSPTLVAKWNDQVFVTGSNPAPSVGLTVVPATLKSVYRMGETVRVDLAAREQYPLKTFDTTSATFAGDHYLPSSSYYSIVDEQSGISVVPFSDESRISTSGNKSYFTFTVENMFPQRFYRVLLRVEHDGLSEIFDNNSIFTIK